MVVVWSIAQGLYHTPSGVYHRKDFGVLEISQNWDECNEQQLKLLDSQSLELFKGGWASYSSVCMSTERRGKKEKEKDRSCGIQPVCCPSGALGLTLTLQNLGRSAFDSESQLLDQAYATEYSPNLHDTTIVIILMSNSCNSSYNPQVI